MKELLELLNARARVRSVPYALATVLRVEGSSYRRPGARMLIDIHGRVAGSVSGGCLEKSVVAQGQVAIADGQNRLLTFDTTDSDDSSFGTSLGCQGMIWIGVEVIPPHVPWPLDKIAREIQTRRTSAVLIVQSHCGENGVTFQSRVVYEGKGDEDAPLWPELSQEVAAVMRLCKTRCLENGSSELALIEWLGPPVALMLFGGGPDVRPLTRLARELGHEVTVLDRRADVARAENFPEANKVVLAKPWEIAGRLRSDSRTAAIVMNHHYDTDRDTLAALVPLHLPYIAMLGPKRRTARILAELQEEGHDTASLERILHAPAGLDIGAETPEQIALAILAEIQATLSQRDGGRLRYRNAPIHADSFIREAPPCVLPV
jgi:xanthine dehydrogenase accessory factor